MTPATEASGVWRATGHKVAGLRDRPCRPHRPPRRLELEQEAGVVSLRRAYKLGPHRLAARTGNPRSTCSRVLRQHTLHRPDWLGRPTGRLFRRHEYLASGEPVRVDVKKLGRSRAVQLFTAVLTFPLAFASSVFVRPSTMPWFLQPWVRVSAISLRSDTVRGRQLGGAVLDSGLKILAWGVGLVALLAPLAVRANFRRA